MKGVEWIRLRPLPTQMVQSFSSVVLTEVQLLLFDCGDCVECFLSLATGSVRTRTDTQSRWRSAAWKQRGWKYEERRRRCSTDKTKLQRLLVRQPVTQEHQKKQECDGVWMNFCLRLYSKFTVVVLCAAMLTKT